jgi:hypothetical protein
MKRVHTLLIILVMALGLSASAYCATTSMVYISPENFCIDRYEATFGSDLTAISIPGVWPQVYVSGQEASLFCAAAGKRLCTDAEWLRACRGPDNNFVYPYGNELIPGACNDMGSIKLTGESPECVSLEGVYDLVGNVNEWTSDPSGTARGGYYLDISINGIGCGYATTAYNFQHYDAYTGFRCCDDAIAPGACRVSYTPDVEIVGNLKIGTIIFEDGTTQNTAAASSSPSDIREKKDIKDISLGLGFISSLRPVEFRMKKGNDRKNFGFIAQDIEALLGTEYNIIGISGGPARMLSLRYTDFIAPMVKAIQEQQKIIENLNGLVDNLNSENEKQYKINQQMQKELDELKAQISRMSVR